MSNFVITIRHGINEWKWGSEKKTFYGQGRR